MSFSAHTYSRAIATLRADGGVVPDKRHANVFTVKGSDTYRVQVYGHDLVTCTCPNGSARGGTPTCYHALAVLLWMDAERAEASDESR